MKRYLPVLACVISTLLGELPATSSAQDAATDKPALTMHVQAREVLLPVTVRDKHGALVTDLQISDFTLTEDGRPQVIKSFTHETQSAFPSSGCWWIPAAACRARWTTSARRRASLWT